ncbi:MAG: molybdopterin-dependent oxidoreductase [Anaerolineales bacterium]|nr:molybdopterin-dependent oxidoreductase [Anaerolineales bacterium]
MDKPIIKLLFIFLIAILFSCCNPATPEPIPTATTAPTTEPTKEPTPEPTATATEVVEPTKVIDPTGVVEAEPEAVVLTITGVDSILELTMSDLKEMPAYEGWGGLKNSVGNITPPAVYKGVLLKDLVDLIGGIDESAGVNIIAEDGYAMTLSYDQIYNGNFVAYDPGGGDETAAGGDLYSVIAYEVDGQPLPKKSDGTLRLVVLGQQNNQVTDGHWWVKWTNAVEVISQGEEWYLYLEGALTEEMDRATFESCASPSCHGVSWIDEEGHEWSGAPLYLIAARVDDENKHDFGGFNVTLADQGYIIEFVATDGYTVEVESGQAKLNENMIIAVNMDGEPLPEKYYPLRFVGSELDKGQMVGQIEQIKVHLQPAEIITPALTVAGLVDTELVLRMEDLKEMEIVEVSDAESTYEGIPLNNLLASANPKWEASVLIAIAGDGYSVEINLAKVKACADCIVAFGENEELQLVMPGMEKKAWVNGVVTIEVTQAGNQDNSDITVEEESAPEPLPSAAEGEAALTVSGSVENELLLTMETLLGLEMVQITTEHPKTETMEDYAGILVNDLLTRAVPTSSATSIALTASDGYFAEISLADLLACIDCLVNPTDQGTLNLVMPGMPSSMWVKELVLIQVN